MDLDKSPAPITMVEPATSSEDLPLRGATPRPIRQQQQQQQREPSETPDWEDPSSESDRVTGDSDYLLSSRGGVGSLDAGHHDDDDDDDDDGDDDKNDDDKTVDGEDKLRLYSMPDQGRTRQYSQSSSSRRHQHQPPPPQPAAAVPHYATASPEIASQGFPPPYAPRQGSYVGQYTMPTMQHHPPPPPLNMGPHTSTSPYSYSQGYQHQIPGMPPADSSMNLHTSYQPMLQPHHTTVYPYHQRHSPDASSHPYQPAALYTTTQQQQQAGASSSPSTTSPSQGTPASPTNFQGSGQFHSLRYPSPLPSLSTGYPTYAPQSFPASPIYQSQQYGPAYQPYGAPSSSADSDGQGLWWYMPSGAAVPARQYEGTPPAFSGHYPMSFSSPVAPTPDGDTSSPTYGSSPSMVPPPPPAQGSYPLSPLRSFANEPPSSPSSQGKSGTLQGRGERVMPASPRPDSRSSSGVGAGPADKPIVRRPYHPNPPAHRSEWVMWSGNVPSDATHDELWRFFNQPPPNDHVGPTGVMSIFLISRSSCAFVNYESEAFLTGAIARFNGVPLRPNDPRCPRLVCRVRKKDDDLKAGVGGQRGMGMHTSWIKAQKAKQRQLDGGGEEKDKEQSSTSEQSEGEEPSTPSDQLSQRFTPSISISSSEDDGSSPRRGKHSTSGSGSGSFASTNSSILGRYFPQRYFILKSLTQYDLDLSVEKGVWATQKHNEGVLDQAYRTSKEVFLFFGVNKSGEFYGYAKMAGPVRQGEHRVSWAQRTDSSSSSRSSLSPISHRQPDPDRLSGSPDAHAFFAPKEHRMVDKSPQPVSPGNPLEQKTLSALHAHGGSAPPELHEPHRKLTLPSPAMVARGKTVSPVTQINSPGEFLDKARMTKSQENVGDMISSPDIHLDPSKPLAAMKQRAGGDVSGPSSSALDGLAHMSSNLSSVAEEEDNNNNSRSRSRDKSVDTGVTATVFEPGTASKTEESWGESFKIEWICTERLPFYRTRHIRNPWNHDREVKVSRDGTELEPSVGQKLIEEWNKSVEEQQQQQQPPPSTSKAGGPNKRGGQSTKMTGSASSSS